MKLSLKELKEIRNNLHVDSEIFKKVCEEINYKKFKSEIKKAQRKIKLANETLKSCCEMIDFKKEETLSDLINDISAITGIEYNSNSCLPYKSTIITVNFNDLKEGEFDRIIKVKNNHLGYYIKSIH